jgi:hypothetical protein
LKIVSLADFLQFPPGTVFAKYAPIYFGELCIKGDSVGERDFEAQSFLQIDSISTEHEVAILSEAEEAGLSVMLNLDCQGRDGCFEDTQLFAVYEQQDVLQLITRLQRALTDSSKA